MRNATYCFDSQKGTVNPCVTHTAINQQCAVNLSVKLQAALEANNCRQPMRYATGCFDSQKCDVNKCVMLEVALQDADSQQCAIYPNGTLQTALTAKQCAIYLYFMLQAALTSNNAVNPSFMLQAALTANNVSYTHMLRYRLL